MRTFAAMAVIFLAVHLLAGCLHPIKRIDRRCVNSGAYGRQLCECRDLETGRFIRCQ